MRTTVAYAMNPSNRTPGSAKGYRMLRSYATSALATSQFGASASSVPSGQQGGRLWLNESPELRGFFEP